MLSKAHPARMCLFYAQSRGNRVEKNLPRSIAVRESIIKKLSFYQINVLPLALTEAQIHQQRV